ncbi:MAG: flagellar biosynthetic protein FliR [Pseudomonadota bacterium]
MVFLITAFLVAARVAGAVMVMPVFATLGVPRMYRLAAALCLTVIIAPTAPQVGVPTLSVLVLGMIGEVLVGVVMGGTVGVLFGALTLASDLMGMQIGLRIAAVFDPLSVEQTGLIASLARWLATLVFLGADMHLFLLEAIGDSFQLVPPGSASDPLAAGALWVPTLGYAIACGLRLAGPVMVLLFLVQAFLGVLVRLAPSMNVFFAVGLVVNVIAGLALLHETLPILLVEHLEMTRGAIPLVLRAAELVR